MLLRFEGESFCPATLHNWCGHFCSGIEKYHILLQLYRRM